MKGQDAEEILGSMSADFLGSSLNDSYIQSFIETSLNHIKRGQQFSILAVGKNIPFSSNMYIKQSVEQISRILSTNFPVSNMSSEEKENDEGEEYAS
jgi:hypothetical protein